MMKRIARYLKTLSRVLYWFSMLAVAATLFVVVTNGLNPLAYAYALLSVVSMMVSSALLYGHNMIGVGSEIIKKEDAEKEG